jgi:hypothetical protein
VRPRTGSRRAPSRDHIRTAERHAGRHRTVNFNAGLVNTHSVELTLLDGRARVAKKYTVVLWNNSAVIEDLQRLLAEPRQ